MLLNIRYATGWLLLKKAGLRFKVQAFVFQEGRIIRVSVRKQAYISVHFHN